LITQHLF